MDRRTLLIAAVPLLIAASPLLIAASPLPIAASPLPIAASPLQNAASPIAAVPQKPLTIERLFASPSLDGVHPYQLKLSPDGKFVTYLKPRANDQTRLDLWAIDTTSGQQRMLVDSDKVESDTPLSEAEKMHRERARIGHLHGIVEYQWAPDGKSIMVPVGGNMIDFATPDGWVAKLTHGQAMLDPQVSETSHYTSYVQDQNVHVVDLQLRKKFQITKMGGGTTTCGTAEFVAQEEMGRFTGTWWAPDEKHVAIECFDEAHVQSVTRTAIGADATKTFDQRYPAAGTPNVAVALWVMNPDGSGSVKVDLGVNPDIYLARADWSPDGRTLYVQRQSRDQKTLDVLAVDPVTGASRTVFRETSSTWIDLTDDFRALKDGSLLWGSQRDGYRHLYRWQHGKWTQLTRGPWMVTSLIGVDEARHRLYFNGTMDSVLESQVYAIDYLHPGQPQRLTEPGFSNTGAMDRYATRLIVRRSSPEQPPQAYLADTSGKRVAWIDENKLDANHPFAPYMAAHRTPTFGTIKAADGSTLHYAMITPPLEPGKKYPVLFEHYGGPGVGQMVTHSWAGGFPDYWASKGWITFKIDNRGSPNRGTAFESQIYHRLGTVEVEDQNAGALWLQQQPFIDPKKIAISGGSYGGYLTVRMLEKAPPGLYAAGTASSSVTLWELYDTHYTERYLGDPKQDPGSYEAADVIKDATRIQTPLLIAHGFSDDNVVFQNSAALINALQAANKPFEMMLYVGQTHGMGDPEREAHATHNLERFLDVNVLGKMPDSENQPKPNGG